MHCLCCKGFGDAANSREPPAGVVAAAAVAVVVAAAAAAVPEAAGCRVTDAAAVPEDSSAAAKDNGLVQNSVGAPTSVERRDGVGAVVGLHPVANGGPSD